MTEASKNVYIDKLDKIIHKYNNTYHRIIRMKPVDYKPGMYIAYGIKHNEEGAKFKVGDHVRISKYKKQY